MYGRTWRLILLSSTSNSRGFVPLGGAGIELPATAAAAACLLRGSALAIVLLLK